jgi:hypothetical protein
MPLIGSRTHSPSIITFGELCLNMCFGVSVVVFILTSLLAPIYTFVVRVTASNGSFNAEGLHFVSPYEYIVSSGVNTSVFSDYARFSFVVSALLFVFVFRLFGTHVMTVNVSIIVDIFIITTSRSEVVIFAYAILFFVISVVTITVYTKGGENDSYKTHSDIAVCHVNVFFAHNILAM